MTMARTNSEIQQHEVQAYAKFCDENNIVHDGSEGDAANSALVLDYFTKQWGEMITAETLSQAFPQLKPHLKFNDPNQVEFNKLYNSLSAEEKAAFAEWKGSRGLKDTFGNAVALLSWIKAHGFKVTQANLQLAVGQQRVAPFLEWDESGTPRYEDARQHKSDGEGFLGKDINLNPAQHRARMRSTQPEEFPSSIRGREVAAAKSDAEALRGRTHGETAQLQRVYITNDQTNEIDWVKTLDARQQMQRAFERRNAVTNRSIR
jgi:hypothetical protein